HGAVGQRSGNGEAVFSVRNGSPHTVSGYAECYAGTRAAELSGLRKADGTPAAFQKTGPNRYIIRADDVPAGGSLSLIPEFTKEARSVPAPKDTSIPPKIQSCGLTFSLGRTGLISGIAAYGVECCEGPVGELWAEDLIDVPNGNKNASMTPVRERRVWREEDATGRLAEDGPLFAAIVRNGRIGRAVFEERIVIWKADGRIDFAVRLNKPECPQKESYYVAFPMAHAKDGGIYYDQNIGVVNVCRDLLPGACQELFHCSRYASVEGDGFTSTLCVPDAPLVCFGGMNLCKWGRELPFKPGNGHIYNIIYNNVCNTDAQCWMDILDTFRYSLFIRRGRFSPVAAQEQWESAMALSCEYNAPSEFRAVDGFPKELRLHPVGDGEFWLENLTEAAVDYDFTLLGQRQKGAIPPRGLCRL
ncbi:MAG: hypothetical protein J5833_04720, partial [Victivallales bacterium]|nr:hypothetical protein [Victivallales bacterium]